MFTKSLPLVLLVEDSPDDVDFARRALAKSGLPHRLVVAEQGEQALELLSGRNSPAGNSAALRPDLILLDLNIPGMPGRDLLARIKEHPELRSIPVVILSTSQHPSDIRHCYRSGANSYHCKSDDLARYQTTMRQIVEYWLGAVVPPTALGESLSEPCASSPLKNAFVAFFNLAKCGAQLRTARKITTCVAILSSHPCDVAAR